MNDKEKLLKAIKPGNKVQYRFIDCNDDDNDWFAYFDLYIDGVRVYADMGISTLFEYYLVEGHKTVPLEKISIEGIAIIIEENMEILPKYHDFYFLLVPEKWYDVYLNNKAKLFDIKPSIYMVASWCE